MTAQPSERDRERAERICHNLPDYDGYNDETWGAQVRFVAQLLADERERVLRPVLEVFDQPCTIRPDWEFERGILRGIEMCEAAVRRATQEPQ